MRKTSTYLIVAAAVASFSLSASAQFQLNTGNAADANTRANSYGSNGPDNTRPVNSAVVNGNQYVTGNVTGGRSLQTNPGYFAPGQLETYTGAEQFQDFIRDSTGVPQPYQQSQPGYVAPQSFYGGSTTATPPSGYVRNTVTGSYVPVTPPQPQMSYDTRVDLLNPGGISPADAGLTPSQSIVPQTSIVSGGELYGPTVTPGQEQEQAQSPFNNAYREWTDADKQAVNSTNIAQMRNELNQSQNSTNDQNQNNSSKEKTNGVTPGSLNPTSLTPQPLNAQPNSDLLAQNNAGQQTNQTPEAQQNTALLSPAQQSAQYAQLQQRFNSFGAANHSGTGTGANAGAGASQTSEENNGNEKNSSSSPQMNSAEENARMRAQLYPPSVASSGPLMIHSLAVGIRAHGLRDIMADAEEHMRQGHYAEAMLRYSAAAQVAPNNPLIAMGKAFSELGAGYYARADHDLRTALGADPVLLMGRYDLKNLLGENRLEYVVRDLKQITVSDKANPDAPFLLAYIAYNNGSDTAAGQYLDLTEQRVNGPVPLITEMRQYWNLPAAKK